MENVRTKNILDLAGFQGSNGPILDVRSPVEFERGHIPGATNFPLFSNEERAKIGTVYKEEGRDAAIELGLAFVAPRADRIVEKARALSVGNKVRIHCWRGGLRSKEMVRLLQDSGLQAVALAGGYKSYRRWAQKVVSEPREILILCGLTGTGKTDILESLGELGEQILNLEDLANHRGSSYGALGMPPQPTTHHFGNLIAERLFGFNSSERVWIEAESPQVGTCWIPEHLAAAMRSAPAVETTRSLDERLDILTKTYGDADRDQLIIATERIEKRLGGERTRDAVKLIRQDDLRGATAIILEYYDRTYLAHQKRRGPDTMKVDVSGLDPAGAAAVLVEKAKEMELSGMSIAAA